MFVSAVWDVAAFCAAMLARRVALGAYSGQICEAWRLVTASTCLGPFEKCGERRKSQRGERLDPAELFAVPRHNVSDIGGLALWVSTGNSIALFP